MASATAALGTLFALPATAAAEVRPATPSNFSSVFASAQSGDVVALAAGQYGTFTGGAKAGTVTVTPQPGAVASMSVNFNAARNVRLDGLTISGMTLIGSTRDITVANSRFTGTAVVRTDGMVNANIVFDGNTHEGIDVCNNCYEGRLEVIGQGSGPVGVTVQNSRFGPGGNSDGMQVGAGGVQILNNEFVGIRVVGSVHSDSLQLYDASNTVVRGNYFHDSDVSIMAPDGGRNEQISDNVFVSGGQYRPAIQLGSHTGTAFVHNTVRGIDVFMDAKSGAQPSANGVLRDNVMVDGGFHAPSNMCVGCEVSFNLFSNSSQRDGSNVLVGMPAFVGGPNPGSYPGFALANGSPGKGNASDGTDRGVRITPQPAPGSMPPALGTKARAITKLSLKRRISWQRLRRHGLRVRITAAVPVRLALLLARKGAKRPFATKRRRMAPGARGFVIRPRRRALGHRRPRRIVLRVTATGAAGAKLKLRRVIRVTR